MVYLKYQTLESLLANEDSMRIEPAPRLRLVGYGAYMVWMREPMSLEEHFKAYEEGGVCPITNPT